MGQKSVRPEAPEEESGGSDGGTGGNEVPRLPLVGAALHIDVCSEVVCAQLAAAQAVEAEKENLNSSA